MDVRTGYRVLILRRHLANQAKKDIWLSVCGLKGHENDSLGFTLGNLFYRSCPHKALPTSALLEKHPVRRVGGAEGAAESRLISQPPPSLQQRNQNCTGFGDLAVGFDEFFGGGMEVWGVEAEAFAEFGLKK
ncbi:MAG: hypothetical protein QOG92_2668 [Verrucomicrobiota bacterium]|nr:hypothetical protein [Verrucomicrobiota bacterium]